MQLFRRSPAPVPQPVPLTGPDIEKMVKGAHDNLDKLIARQMMLITERDRVRHDASNEIDRLTGEIRNAQVVIEAGKAALIVMERNLPFKPVPMPDPLPGSEAAEKFDKALEELKELNVTPESDAGSTRRKNPRREHSG